MLYNGDYEDGQLTDLGATIDLAFNTLSLPCHRETFDAIVVRGISGLLVGPAVAVRLGVPLIVVRKPGEKSHSVSGKEDPVTGEIHYPGKVHGINRHLSLRVLFLDDFISSGDTFRAAKAAVEAESEYTVVASYSYRDNSVVDRRPLPQVATSPTAVSFR